MAYEKLKEMYVQRNASEIEFIQATAWCDEWLDYLSRNQLTTSIESLKMYIHQLIVEENNNIERLVAIARYCYIESLSDLYIYFTSLFGSFGVVDEIRKRMVNVVGKEISEKVFSEIIEPPLGEATDQMPTFTIRLMTAIKENMNEDQMKKVLAGNNHQIPVSAMLKEKEYYEQAKNIDDYLEKRHKRKVAELRSHMIEDKIWFEQIITKEVIDFVEANQEVLSAVRKGNQLLVTKIPYDTKAFLEAKEDIRKRYFACHCPFARTSILDQNEVDSDWCYCSAGFAKFPFEVMFERDLEIELLDSPLKGDLMCRFSITLPDGII